jgi:ribonuclease P protein component
MSERRGGIRQGRPRLTRSADFDRVYRKGRSAATRTFVLYAFPSSEREDAGPPQDRADVRLGVSVGRRVGGAVDRNRVKRLLREAFWALDEELPEGYDFVIVARAGSSEAAEQHGLDGIRAELAGLLAQLSLGTPAVQEG